jgi:hypothetical protein
MAKLQFPLFRKFMVKFILQGSGGNREFQVGKCILQPKFEAVGEGSGFTVSTPLLLYKSAYVVSYILRCSWPPF